MSPDPTRLVQFRKGVLDGCILAQLEHQPAYGLELVGQLGADSVLLASEGSIYPLLARLRDAGLVETTWQQSASGPPRRYYQLTPAGRAELAAFRHTWQVFAADVARVLQPRKDRP